MVSGSRLWDDGSGPRFSGCSQAAAYWPLSQSHCWRCQPLTRETTRRGSELLTRHCRKLGLPQGVMAGERLRVGETEEGGRPRQLQSFTTSSWEWRSITCILLPIRLALYSVGTTPQGVNDSPLSWEAGSIGIILDTLHHTTLLSQAFNHLVNYFLQHYFNELIIFINFIKLLHSDI